MSLTQKDWRVARIGLWIMSWVFWAGAGWGLGQVLQDLIEPNHTLMIHSVILIGLAHLFSLKASECSRYIDRK